MTQIPQTTVLELSQRSADIVHINNNGDPRNGDFTCHFAEPITLKEGDQLNLRMASIDSQRATTESVVIPEGGQNISMQFSYFDQNYRITTPAHTFGSGTATPSPPDPAQQKIEFGTRGTTNVDFPPTFEAHVSYFEPDGAQLDSIQLKGVGGRPFTVEPFGDRTDTQEPIVVICAPQFSWVDLDGKFRMNTGALGIGNSNLDSENNVITKSMAHRKSKPGRGSYSTGGQTKADVYQYIGATLGVGSSTREAPFSTFVTDVPCLPNSSLAKNQLSQINKCESFPYPTVGAEKITFRTGSLRLLGVIGMVVVDREQEEGSGTEPDNFEGFGLYNYSSLNTWQQLSVNTTNIPDPLAEKQLFTSTQGITIPEGRYDRTTLAQVITQEFSEVGLTVEKQAGGNSVFGANTNLQLRMDADGNEQLVFREVPDSTQDNIVCNGANSYQYPTATTTTLGARIFSMDYGSIGNAYRISNMHQSVNSGLKLEEGQEQTGLFVDVSGGKTIYHELLNATGLVVHDLLPQDFWQDTLGLYDQMVVPLRTDPSGVQFFTVDDMADKTTSETAQIQSFSVNNQRGTPAPTSDTYFNTTEVPTKSIIGNQPRISENAGTYYLVEITGLNIPQSNLIDSTENMANISAIVSKQYDQNDIITAFADSAIPYVHRGIPVRLASARVRILDPITKDVVTTLGDQNSVFLQVSSVDQPLPTQNQVRGTVPK